jgi:hypothetical protein
MREDHFHSPPGPESLGEEFKQALAEQNVEAFAKCVERLEEVLAHGKHTGGELSEVLRSLQSMARMHGDLIAKWAEEEPRIVEVWERFAAHMDSLFGIHDA